MRAEPVHNADHRGKCGNGTSLSVRVLRHEERVITTGSNTAELDCKGVCSVRFVASVFDLLNGRGKNPLQASEFGRNNQQSSSISSPFVMIGSKLTW